MLRDGRVEGCHHGYGAVQRDGGAANTTRRRSCQSTLEEGDATKECAMGGNGGWS